MTGDELLMQQYGREAANLRAFFPHLPESDVLQILASPTPGQAVSVLEQCFGCDQEDAKAAWNDYVMRYVDGAKREDSPDGAGRYVS